MKSKGVHYNLVGNEIADLGTLFKWRVWSSYAVRGRDLRGREYFQGVSSSAIMI